MLGENEAIAVIQPCWSGKTYLSWYRQTMDDAIEIWIRICWQKLPRFTMRTL